MSVFHEVVGYYSVQKVDKVPNIIGLIIVYEHTKCPIIFNRVNLNPNDTPNSLSILSFRFRNTKPLILASNSM